MFKYSVHSHYLSSVCYSLQSTSPSSHLASAVYFGNLGFLLFFVTTKLYSCLLFSYSPDVVAAVVVIYYWFVICYNHPLFFLLLLVQCSLAQQVVSRLSSVSRLLFIIVLLFVTNTHTQSPSLRNFFAQKLFFSIHFVLFWCIFFPRFL